MLSCILLLFPAWLDGIDIALLSREWRNYCKVAITTSFKVKYNATVKGKLIREHLLTYHYLDSDRSKIEYITTEYDKDGKTTTIEEVYCYNPEYRFKLIRSKNGAFRIEDAFRSTAEKPDYIVNRVHDARSWILMPICKNGVKGDTLDQQFGSGALLVESADIDESNCSITYSESDKYRRADVLKRKGTFKLLGKTPHAIVSDEYTTSYKDGSTIHGVVRNEFSSQGGQPILVKHTESKDVVDSKGERWKNQILTTVQIIGCDANHTDYTLTKYGFSEPTWLRKSGEPIALPLHLILTFSGVAALVVAIIVLYRRNKRQAA